MKRPAMMLVWDHNPLFRHRENLAALASERCFMGFQAEKEGLRHSVRFFVAPAIVHTDDYLCVYEIARYSSTYLPIVD